MADDVTDMTPGQILADTNVATYIENLGLGIARAQQALDRNSLETAVALATERPEFSDRSLLELGFNPTFYHYQHADLDVSLQITMRVDRQVSLQIGTDYNKGKTSSTGSTDTGTATIKVKLGGGTPAEAKVKLLRPAAGKLKVGATQLELASGASAPNVAIVANSVRQTALALAERLESDAVPEVARALVEVVPGGTPITPETNASGVFKVGTNQVEIVSFPAKPARAWVTVLSAGRLNLSGTVNVTYETTPTPEEGLVAKITSQLAATHKATLLFQRGKSAQSPRFLHNRFDQFEADVDVARIRTLVDFLTAKADARVRIRGHADTSGEDSPNLTLSQKRADFIKKYLTDHGIPADRIESAQGFGEREPLPGHQEKSKRDPENRRVELELVGGITNVVLIETVQSGEAQKWDAAHPAFVSNAGTPLASLDGTNAVPFTAGTYVGVRDHFFYVNAVPASPPKTPGHPFTPGGSAEDAAKALAKVILEQGGVDAYAEGRFVRLLPAESHAILEIQTTARSEAANDLDLKPEGSLVPERGFAGGTDGGEPRIGDTVTLGAATLTCRAEAPEGSAAFAKGDDAAKTATSLATAIKQIAGYSAAATGDTVTVTGPVNSALGTSNPTAFVLSATRLSGTLPIPERREENKATLFGLSVDAGYQRRFGLDATGNSRITTRLVSVPAPVELLEEIRTWLNGNPAPR